MYLLTPAALRQHLFTMTLPPWSILAVVACFPLGLSAAVLQFSSAAYTVSEKAKSIRLPVLRSGDLSATDTVQFVTADVTAAAGQDYVATNGTLRFGPRSRQAFITVALLGDTVFEPREAFTVSLVNPGGAGLLGAVSTAAVTIVDDDPAGTIRLGRPAFKVMENARAATITVLRPDGTASGVSVDYAATAGTASPASDFTPVSGTLVFGAREKRKTFTIPVLPDAISDGTKTVLVALGNPAGGAALGSPSNAVLSILNKGGGPCTNSSLAISFSAATNANAITSTFIANNGDSGIVTLENPFDHSVSGSFSGETSPCAASVPSRGIEFGIFDPGGAPVAGRTYALGFPDSQSTENYIEYREGDSAGQRRWRSAGPGALTIDAVTGTTVTFHVTGALLTAEAASAVTPGPNGAQGSLVMEAAGSIRRTSQ